MTDAEMDIYAARLMDVAPDDPDLSSLLFAALFVTICRRQGLGKEEAVALINVLFRGEGPIMGH